MLTEDSVKMAVKKCKSNGLTDIFVVVWTGGLTTYPSKVVEKYIGINQNPIYRQFDPLSSFISEGHKVGLRVHAWFEFGFSVPTLFWHPVGRAYCLPNQTKVIASLDCGSGGFIA
jgi:uncharacterized lipoprotein YddW (UPF0748 family)